MDKETGNSRWPNQHKRSISVDVGGCSGRQIERADAYIQGGHLIVWMEQSDSRIAAPHDDSPEAQQRLDLVCQAAGEVALEKLYAAGFEQVSNFTDATGLGEPTAADYEATLRVRHPGAVLLVEFEGLTSSLASFAEANVDGPDVVEELLKVPLGLGVRAGIGGGWSSPFRLLTFLPRTGETMTTLPGDDRWYVCRCGNEPDGDGHYACDAQGADQHSVRDGVPGGPDPGWDGVHLKCSRCWRVFRQSDLGVVGRVAPRACPAPTCLGMGADPVDGVTCKHCDGEWTSPGDDGLAAEDEPFVRAVEEHLGHDAAARSAVLNRIYTGGAR